MITKSICCTQTKLKLGLDTFLCYPCRKQADSILQLPGPAWYSCKQEIGPF